MRKRILKKILCAVSIIFILFLLVKLTVKKSDDNDSCLLHFSYNNTIVRIENEIKPQIYSVTKEDDTEYTSKVTSAAIDKNTKDIYYIVDTKNYNSTKVFQTIYHIGRDGKQEVVDVLDSTHTITIDVFAGRLYTLMKIYDIHGSDTNIVYKETVYEQMEDGTYFKTTKNQQLYEQLCNNGRYELIMAMRNDGMDGHYTIPYCMRNFRKILMLDKEENSIVIFNKAGKQISEIKFKQELLNLYAYNDDYIIYSSKTDTHWRLIYYDLITNKEKILVERICEDEWKILGFEDGKLYYAITENLDSESDKENAGYVSGVNKIYEYCIKTGEEQLIYTGYKIPGMDMYFEPGISGFRINKGKCYFLATEGKDMEWYLIDLNNNSKDPIPLNIITKHYEFSDFGKVRYKSINNRCSKCDFEVFEAYAEVFELDEKYKGAQIINQELAAEMQEEIDHGNEMIIIEHEYHKEYKYLSSNQYHRRIEKVERIGEQYLAVNYSGYLYRAGMGHGEPFRSHEMYNLDTGRKVSFSDFYTGSKEDFKSKVAEYTIIDWKENPKKYYSSIEEEFYESVYNYASFDMPMQFTKEGIVVEYEPYHYGPFSSGIIAIRIPYKEFNITDF